MHSYYHVLLDAGGSNHDLIVYRNHLHDVAANMEVI